MPKRLAISVRRDSALAQQTGAITSNDSYEKAEYHASRSREFRDALTKAGWMPSEPGLPTHTLQWSRWSP